MKAQNAQYVQLLLEKPEGERFCHADWGLSEPINPQCVLNNPSRLRFCIHQVYNKYHNREECPLWRVSSTNEQHQVLGFDMAAANFKGQ